jgi:hypothetical protein
MDLTDLCPDLCPGVHIPSSMHPHFLSTIQSGGSSTSSARNSRSSSFGSFDTDEQVSRASSGARLTTEALVDFGEHKFEPEGLPPRVRPQSDHLNAFTDVLNDKSSSDPHMQPPKQKPKKGAWKPSRLNEMAPIDELTVELNISAEHLESCKRETYQRTFRLWMPMVHDFNVGPEDDEFEERNLVEVLPVDELLDRVMLRRVRMSAVRRSILFLLFNFLFCTSLIMQRSLSDSFELESALKVQCSLQFQ